jgi:hypothetical protein
MKARLLEAWPDLSGRVMTVRGFVKGFTPEDEEISEEEAYMEDAGGKDIDRKLLLYVEHENLARQIADRLLNLERGESDSSSE